MNDAKNALDSNLSKALNDCDRKVVNKLVKSLVKVQIEGLDPAAQGQVNILKDSLESTQVNRIFDDFDKLMESDKLKDLNKEFSDDEIDTLASGIISGKIKMENALNLYKKMDNIRIEDTHKFQSTDRKYFSEIRQALENIYKLSDSNSPKSGGENAREQLADLQLGEMFKYSHHLYLNELVNEYGIKDWKGGNLDGVTITPKEGDTFTGEEFMNKFNEVNGERIKGVGELGELVIGNISDDILGQLTYQDDKFYMGNTEVTYEAMVSLLNVNANSFDILDYSELGEEHFKSITEGWKKALKQKIDKFKQSIEDQQNLGFEGINNIKDGLAIDKINNYIGKDILRNVEGGYQCNISNVKEFLGKIGNGVDFNKDFIQVGSDSRKAWLTAVQILLNKEYGGNLKVDGQYVKGGETYNAIKKFQGEYNKSKKEDGKYPDGFKPLVEDGIPGPLTLGKLLGAE